MHNLFIALGLAQGQGIVLFIEPEGIMLVKLEKDKYCLISLLCGI